MEAKLIKYSSDQQASPCKQKKITTPKKVSRVCNSKPSENFAPASIHGHPLLPPMPYHSFSSFCPSPAHFNHLIQYQNHTIHRQQQRQPPLLPLPSMTKPYLNSLPSRNQPVASPPTIKKMKKGCKKSKPVRKEDAKPSKAKCDALLNSSKTPLRPERNEIPKDVFSSIVAPPPSSLPLPKFSIRPKLSCKEEGGDVCAADDLRRMLRIR